MPKNDMEMESSNSKRSKNSIKKIPIKMNTSNSKLYKRSISPPKGFDKAINRMNLASQIKERKNNVKHIPEIKKHVSKKIEKTDPMNEKIFIEINLGNERYYEKNRKNNI